MPEKGAEKIDIAIVVDMLLTGFDASYLNTLYVDKNLKHHGLIQAFSRTNRVLNATKPYGHILDFRQQQGSVDMPPSRCSPARRPTGRRKSGWSTRRPLSSRTSSKPSQTWTSSCSRRAFQPSQTK